MTVWVVAFEYAGPDLQSARPAARRPVLEHVYDLHTGLLAHLDNPPRIGFPHPARGWPQPTRLPRCEGCILAVTTLVAGVVSHGVAATLARSIDDVMWAARTSHGADNQHLGGRRDGDVWLWSRPPGPFAV